MGSVRYRKGHFTISHLPFFKNALCGFALNMWCHMTTATKTTKTAQTCLCSTCSFSVCFVFVFFFLPLNFRSFFLFTLSCQKNKTHLPCSMKITFHLIEDYGCLKYTPELCLEPIDLAILSAFDAIDSEFVNEIYCKFNVDDNCSFLFLFLDWWTIIPFRKVTNKTKYMPKRSASLNQSEMNICVRQYECTNNALIEWSIFEV